MTIVKDRKGNEYDLSKAPADLVARALAVICTEGWNSRGDEIRAACLVPPKRTKAEVAADVVAELRAYRRYANGATYEYAATDSSVPEYSNASWNSSVLTGRGDGRGILGQRLNDLLNEQTSD